MTQHSIASAGAGTARGPYLFVHINKTAGTSFCESLSDSEQVVYDYGTEGPKTSKIVLETMYERSDPYALLCSVSDPATWLVGHFHLVKHCDFVECRRIVTFLRDPLERLISGFNHLRAYTDNPMPIAHYIEHERHRNVQSKYLLGLRRECIGYIGITEKISESYEIVNAGLSVDLKTRHSNKNHMKTMARDALSPELEALVRKYNAADYALYEWALKNHRERYQFLLENKPWCHGFYTLGKNGSLYGVAFFADSDVAVELDVFANAVYVESVTANAFHAEQPKAVFPRRRYVAFKLADTAPNIDYDIVVAATGQKLGFVERRQGPLS